MWSGILNSLRIFHSLFVIHTVVIGLLSLFKSVTIPSFSFFVMAYILDFSSGSNGEGNGNPPQCSCLENPRDGGAWWADVSGVAQSQT